MRRSTRRGGQGHEGPRSLQASATDPPRVAMPSPPCHVGRLCNGLNRAATASCHATPSTYDITILSPFATPPIYDRCCKPSWIDMTLQSSVPGGWAICSKQAILVYIRCFNYARYIVLKHCSSICWQWCTDTCSWKTFDCNTRLADGPLGASGRSARHRPDIYLDGRGTHLSFFSSSSLVQGRAERERLRRRRPFCRSPSSGHQT